MISNKNYSGHKLSDLKEIKNDEVFEYCNFSQHVNKDILIGIKGLTFRNCNLVNVNVPVGSIMENCNNINKSNCKHLHSEIDELADCEIDCEHVIDSDKIYVDGVLKDIIYYYKDTII